MREKSHIYSADIDLTFDAAAAVNYGLTNQPTTAPCQRNGWKKRKKRVKRSRDWRFWALLCSPPIEGRYEIYTALESERKRKRRDLISDQVPQSNKIPDPLCKWLFFLLFLVFYFFWSFHSSIPCNIKSQEWARTLRDSRFVDKTAKGSKSCSDMIFIPKNRLSSYLTILFFSCSLSTQELNDNVELRHFIHSLYCTLDKFVSSLSIIDHHYTYSTYKT